MRNPWIPVVAIIIIITAGCGREEETAVLLVYHDGKEYTILDRGDSMDNGRPAYLVRYYSDNVGDASILMTERTDLCAVIAKHVDTNRHQRVVITAVEREGPFFGLFKPREVTESMNVDQVLKYHPARKKSAVE